MQNNFFSVCDMGNKNDKNKIYECCVNTCTKYSSDPNICYTFCATAYPPIIKELCVFKENCWKEGLYDKECIEKNKSDIISCCLRDCNNFKTNRNSFESLDCDKYCSNYKIHTNEEKEEYMGIL